MRYIGNNNDSSSEENLMSWCSQAARDWNYERLAICSFSRRIMRGNGKRRINLRVIGPEQLV